MTAGRVLWLSPWMRPLARVYSEALIQTGVDVLLVTSEQHPECRDDRDYELVLDPRPKTLATWPEFARGYKVVRAFDADVVITELVRDPRWMLLGHGRPRIELIHDDRPHDAAEWKPRWERELFGRWGSTSAAIVAFSRYVADAIGTADVAPLTSDLSPDLVPVLSPAEDRRDFVLVGRLNPYKNIDVALGAWAGHVSGPHWRGDRLVIMGDGDVPGDLGSHVHWRRGAYAYRDVTDVMSRAKGAIVHYRSATQSGVQVLAMQLGVTPIVSAEGGLPEFQPTGELPIDKDDVSGLTAAFDALADPGEAARRGHAARAHYRDTFSVNVSAEALLGIVNRVSTAPRRVRSRSPIAPGTRG